MNSIAKPSNSLELKSRTRVFKNPLKKIVQDFSKY